jgi:hypothetical protein
MMNYKRMFGTKPKQNVRYPLEKGDNPEMDTSELLDEGGIQQYQSLIEAMQWAISLGRFNITTAVMTLSGFRTAPRIGHLEPVKGVYNYLAKMKHAAICICTEEPDSSSLPNQDFDWCNTVYRDASKLLPTDAPEPLGKHLQFTD